jgi:hypothetical protein
MRPILFIIFLFPLLLFSQRMEQSIIVDSTALHNARSHSFKAGNCFIAAGTFYAISTIGPRLVINNPDLSDTRKTQIANIMQIGGGMLALVFTVAAASHLKGVVPVSDERGVGVGVNID